MANRSVIKFKNKKKNDKRRNILLIAAGSVCLICLVVFGFLFLKELGEYRKGGSLYTEVSQVAGAENNDPNWVPNFAGLADINDDVVGWLRCEGTKIDYPLVQGSDNNEYLHHLFNGVYNKLGTPYLDFRNSATLSDDLTIVYGHNLSSGDMFSRMLDYRKQSFFDEHPTMTVYTPGGNYTLRLFAAYVQDVSNGFDFTFNFNSSSEFDEYIAMAKSGSYFTSSVTPKYGDHLMAFCTCETPSTETVYRFMLVGVLVKEG